jgi:hypothetical protein
MPSFKGEKMIATILGWVLIVMGTLFLLKPEALKNRLQKKGLRKMKRYLFFLTISVALLFIGAAGNIPGLWGKILLIFGIIGIIKAFFLLKAKAAEKMMNWFFTKPLSLFRIGGCLYLLIGLIILLRR